MQLAADGGAADVGIAFEHDDLESRSREIAGVGQSIVTGSDDDGIVVRHFNALAR